MNEVTVSTWNELQDALFEGSWNPGLGRFRSPFVFRGSFHKEHDLATSLIRLGGDYHRLERHLIRNFRKYAHREVVERDALWHWLTVAQHHGLPTRLLDWTYSPLVAMHYATVRLDHMDRDGAVWAVDYQAAADLLPARLASRLRAEGSNVVTTDMLADLVSTLEEFDLLSKRDFVMFLEPPSIDDRIVNQFALFSIVSNPRRRLDELLVEHPDLYRKVVIPAALKWEVRDKLDQANISERVLSPGLDGLSSWLRRHYSSAHRESGRG
jgi:hypothetical protein